MDSLTLTFTLTLTLILLSPFARVVWAEFGSISYPRSS